MVLVCARTFQIGGLRLTPWGVGNGGKVRRARHSTHARTHATASFALFTASRADWRCVLRDCWCLVLLLPRLGGECFMRVLCAGKINASTHHESPSHQPAGLWSLHRSELAVYASRLWFHSPSLSDLLHRCAGRRASLKRQGPWTRTNQSRTIEINRTSFALCIPPPTTTITTIIRQHSATACVRFSVGEMFGRIACVPGWRFFCVNFIDEDHIFYRLDGVFFFPLPRSRESSKPLDFPILINCACSILVDVERFRVWVVACLHLPSDPVIVVP